jgi:HSP90 family molecular chaperone
MTNKKIKINRAPVLTLWAAVVAERLGYGKDTALTLGKAVAGLNAQSKGRRLGIYEEKSEEEKKKEKKKEKEIKTEFIEIVGRGVPTVKTSKGLRAAIKCEEIDPDSVETYLKQKFKDDLDDTRTAMEKLAKAYTPKQLESKAYDLYEKFRPKIPEGTKGWGAKGELDLEYIRSLAK